MKGERMCCFFIAETIFEWFLQREVRLVIAIIVLGFKLYNLPRYLPTFDPICT